MRELCMPYYSLLVVGCLAERDPASRDKLPARNATHSVAGGSVVCYRLGGTSCLPAITLVTAGHVRGTSRMASGMETISLFSISRDTL